MQQTSQQSATEEETAAVPTELEYSSEVQGAADVKPSVDVVQAVLASASGSNRTGDAAPGPSLQRVDSTSPYPPRSVVEAAAKVYTGDIFACYDVVTSTELDQAIAAMYDQPEPTSSPRWDFIVLMITALALVTSPEIPAQGHTAKSVKDIAMRHLSEALGTEDWVSQH